MSLPAAPFHRARHIAALWNEKDPLTRARLLIAFALSESRTFSDPQASARGRLFGQLAAVRPLLTAAEQATLLQFLEWCEANAVAVLGDQADPAQVAI